MKRTIGLFLLAGGLFVGCQQSASNGESTVKSTENPQASNSVEKQIVYVNTDSLLTNYQLATELRKMITEKTIELQTELGSKERLLYGKVEELKRQARGLSQFEGEIRQKKLIEEEQALMKLQETYSNLLAKMEQDATLEVDEAIEDYLNRYCQDKSINLVLSYSKLGVIRWARDGYEITDEVLEGLNKEYEEKKKQESKSE